MADNIDPSKPKPKPKRKPKLHPMVKWLRTIGPAAEAFGWGGLLLADWFWFAVACIYVGFLALIVDVWLEPDLRGKLKWQLSASAVLLLLTSAFSWGVVFVKAPLPVEAHETDGEYPAGTVIAGIKWRPEFTELSVDIENPEDRAYEDLNIVIRPNNAVAEVAQKSSVSDVTIVDADEFAMDLVAKIGQTKKQLAFPVVLIATDSGYRVRCGRLPGHTHLRIVMALVDIKWNPQTPNPNLSTTQILSDPNYMMKVRSDNFRTYWLGYKEGNDYTLRPKSTEWMKVEGTYVVAHRKRSISEKIEIGGSMPPS
jgi:hypothetical protein